MVAVTPAAFASVIREYRRVRTADARRRGRKVRFEPTVLAMESLLMSRSVVGFTGEPLATVAHHGREDASGVIESADDRTRSPGEEPEGLGQQARPMSSGRPGLPACPVAQAA